MGVRLLLLGAPPGDPGAAPAQSLPLRRARGARDGAALLTGLLVCGTCGRRLSVSYQAKTRARYTCVRHLHEAKEQVCYGLKAAAIDDLVARQVLRALEPAALELSLKAVEGIEQERGRLHRHWEQQLERARYEAERAEWQYQAVDPENRLVARTLERRWEEALRDRRHLEDEYDRFSRAQPARLSDGERDRVVSLSGDIPAPWTRPGPPPRIARSSSGSWWNASWFTSGTIANMRT